MTFEMALLICCSILVGTTLFWRREAKKAMMFRSLAIQAKIYAECFSNMAEDEEDIEMVNEWYDRLSAARGVVWAY